MAKKIRLAINGFGRIGRHTFKIALENKNIEIVAINDLSDTKTFSHLLSYDTIYGQYDKKVSATKNSLKVGGKSFKAFSKKDPTQLPWKELNIDVVVEATGAFRTEESASQHLTAGARKVIISAPSKGGNVPTFVRGVNDKKLKKGQHVINNASCTTNCISPIMGIIAERLGIEKAFMTTIHGYTADQRLQDAPHKDLRRARAAAMNIIPTTTGAAIATTETLPQLKGKFDGMAVRVPVATGSLSDFTILTKKKTTPEKVNEIFKKASQNILYRDIIQYTEDPIVSSDIIGNPHSAIFDAGFTKVVGGNLIKVLAWYDNEFGYAHRLVEMVVQTGNR